MNLPAIDPADIRWRLHAFSELSTGVLYDILALRSDVFVVEQNCVYADIDGLDRLTGTRHVTAYDGDTLCAYARSMAPAHATISTASTAPMARIGRVVVSPAYRRRGFGVKLMTILLDDLGARYPDGAITLDAQLVAERMYASLGFERRSEVFLEDGIEHVTMVRA